MGHGIAQVFALAGHDVTINDSVKANLDTAKARIATNLRDLGDDESAVERVRPVADLADCVRDADYVVEAVLGGHAAEAEAVRARSRSTCGPTPSSPATPR